jgi:phage recombination protein Bet
MSNEVAVKNESVIQPVEMATITEYMDTTGLTKRLLPNEKAMFVNMAQLYGLNPFKREIYCNVYGEGQYRQCSIITGYEVYLKRAERIGKLDGWNTQEIGSIKEGNFAVKVTIYRKDWTHPFEHTAYYAEVKQTKKDGSPNRFWATQPRFMTKKVAVAQAFRMCFPDEFGGMPYINDELGEESAPINVTPEKHSEQPRQENVIAPQKAKEPSEAYLALEQVLNEHGIDLRNKGAKVQPFTLAKNCLDNPASTDLDYLAMYKRCAEFLAKKGIQI